MCRYKDKELIRKMQTPSFSDCCRNKDRQIIPKNQDRQIGRKQQPELRGIRSDRSGARQGPDRRPAPPEKNDPPLPKTGAGDRSYKRRSSYRAIRPFVAPSAAARISSIGNWA